MSALHAVRQVILHVVAQVVETKFVVGAVSDVRAVGGAALVIIEIVHDHADAQSQSAIERAHPFRVATRQVIVHRDDVHAAPRQRIQNRGERGNERFSFARLHLRNFAFVQNNAADQLHIEMPHVQEAAAGFADERERRHDRRLQRLLQLLFVGRLRRIGVLQLLLHLGAKLRKARLEVFIAQRTNFGFAGVDSRNGWLQFLDVALVLGADKARDDAIEYLGCFHLGYGRFLTVT